jgi:hypothetical protein
MIDLMDMNCLFHASHENHIKITVLTKRFRQKMLKTHKTVMQVFDYQSLIYFLLAAND